MTSRSFHEIAYEPLHRQHVERKLLRKLDLRMSILVLIYILNFIDRSNVAAARLSGFEDDLHLEGQQFNTVLSIFYVGYTLMQVPSNMYLDKIGRPSIYLPTCVAMWGLISVLMGHFFGAMCTRFFVGFVEAAFFPGALFMLSKWYKRRELGQRTAILFYGLLISNALGSILASAILNVMDGVMGHAAWRWLFYIEGSMTVCVAIPAIFILPDFPATPSGWLTPDEQALAQLRMEEDNGGFNEEEMKDFQDGKSALKQVLADWKVWWLALALTGMNVSLSFDIFFPTLSATLGYSSTLSLLLCTPPWLFAICVAFFMSRHSDQVGERFGHIAISLLVGITGFLMAMTTMNTTIRYLSMFLMAQSYAGFIIFYTWISNSMSRSSSERAIALAFINAFGASGAIAGSYVWPKSWGPSYWGSCAICVGAWALCIIMLWIFRRHLKKLNQEIEAKIEAGQSNDKLTYLL
ncbi:MFS general substrate transporter [Rhizopogon vinicolor AM-OR11-026]|uniref:MFS general substrate transporter n=1 Tax=Rhizopogon vinicolor AM-OR11-026 TaxID=1314800 RepID=A0A1B7N402_9AGAM|nr:MFS general substrate transporter [Rhizopogon vinicolor AM-OR11-026]